MRELEKQRDVEPDWSVNAYMRTETTENRRRSVLTNFVVRMLGLGICADTEVRAGQLPWLLARPAPRPSSWAVHDLALQSSLTAAPAAGRLWACTVHCTLLQVVRVHAHARAPRAAAAGCAALQRRPCCMG